MRTRWVVLGLIALVVLLVTGAALADTGGSMGGGSWGGGGGGSYSGGGGGGWSSSSSGGGWSSSSSGGGWSSSGGSAADCSNMTGVDFLVLLLIIMVVVVFMGLAMASNKEWHPASEGFGSFGAHDVDVSVLRVAIDGRARKFVQTELARIAKVANTRTDEGRAAMLREVSMMLRKLRDAWVYGGAINEPMRDIGAAKRVFDKHVDDARSRFREEVIRNADGKLVTKQASAYTPRNDEGPGLILVSLIIAARRELFTVNKIGNGDGLRLALEAASQLTPGNLVAIEIVWQPAEDDDRLSSMELEAKYPRPDLIPIDHALVGKTFCSYCGGPFPAELVSCPHCGAPAPGRRGVA